MHCLATFDLTLRSLKLSMWANHYEYANSICKGKWEQLAATWTLEKSLFCSLLSCSYPSPFQPASFNFDVRLLDLEWPWAIFVQSTCPLELALFSFRDYEELRTSRRFCCGDKRQQTLVLWISVKSGSEMVWILDNIFWCGGLMTTPFLTWPNHTKPKFHQIPLMNGELRS